MLTDYINSCESIRKAISPVTTIVSETVVCTKRVKNNTSATVIHSIKSTSTKRKGISVTQPNGYIIKRCKSAKFTFFRKEDKGIKYISLDTTMCETTVVKCSFKEFCDKVKKSTCGVLEKIKKECKSECNNICVGSDEICTKFIRVTMEYCKEEATNLILQLNEDLSPELVNTIVLRFIGLQLYLRVIQEFYLLRDNFTTIIDNLSNCYDEIKSCTCGDGGRCCSIEGKCLCSIYYKLCHVSIKLHDRYCKIIKYMKGECDEDLYKVIPSLSLTRSIIILSEYFNDYISSGYMVEESRCGCGYNVYVKPSLIGEITDLAAEIVLWLLNAVNKSKYTGLRTCTCHKYSSKLDDVVTLLLGGIEDVDDCDGLLSDVISMMSPLVELEYMKDGKIKTQTSENITKKNEIEAKLDQVNQQKSTLSNVIQGINGDSSCDGTAVSSDAARKKRSASSTSNSCEICSTETTPAETQDNTTCNGGDINTACREYTNGSATTGCTAGQTDSTQCTCPCPACRSNPGSCCCFYKDTTHDGYDKKINDCLKEMAKKLNADGIKCNSGNNNGTNSLMCYLCVLKCSICKLKDACTVSNGGNGYNIDQTLKELPKNITSVVEKICGNGAVKECCNKCTAGNGCSNGTCTCKNGKCCEVNDRYSNFTKFLLGTNTSCSDTSNNNCKTIANTLITLNGTLNAFLGNGGSSSTNGCQCTNNGGTQNCKNNCCCGTENCNTNGCKENKPIKILSCVIECGLKGIKIRSTNIVNHIEKIEACLTNIQTKMNSLDKCYCELHKCISGLGKCVKNGKDCIKDKIEKLKTAKQKNQGIFKEVIEKSKEVLSDICGLYRVYYIESYSYYLSP